MNDNIPTQRWVSTTKVRNLLFVFCLIFLLLSTSAIASAVPLSGSLQSGVTFTVTTTDDTNDGTCSVDHCSLREAIHAANVRANGAAPDEIHFNLGPDTHRIALSTPLPPITDPVVIDGTTVPGFSGTPVIELDGVLLGDGVSGLTITSGTTTVRGLAINQFSKEGIFITAKGGNVIQGNYIGVDLNGTLGRGNGGDGVHVQTANNTIGGPTAAEGNVVSANGGRGIVLFNPNATGNVIQGNMIGTSAGSTAMLGNGSDGVAVDRGSSNTITGNVIAGNHADGVHFLGSSADNSVLGNVIHSNSGSGVRLASGLGNRVSSNSIFANSSLGIDLDDSGVTPNDAGDADTGANNRQNFPVLIRAVPQSGNTTFQGRLNSTVATTFEIEFFASSTCDNSGHGQGETLLGSVTVTTDSRGNASFSQNLAGAVADGRFVTATATSASGNTSEFSRCISAGPANESWVTALRLSPLPSTMDQYLTRPGQARWYKVSIAPGARLTVKLTNMPANYDVVVYKDIARAFQTLNSEQDLLRLGAEFAPDIFSPDIFSPDIFSPDIFSPDIFSPDIFSPDIFSPDIFSPDIFSPDIFSPDIFSADGFSPDIFSPDIFSPDIFSPDIFSPDIFSPEGAFASAQTRSVVTASGLDGTADELVVVNTWNNIGDYYIRVRGRNGAFDVTAPFRLRVELEAGSCGGVNASALPATSLAASAGNYRTIILTDFGELAKTNLDADVAALTQRLNDLAVRSEVAGVVVNVGADARVAAARTLASNNVACPYAKNVLADAVKALIDRYWELNPDLKYVVLAGNDDVIPFYRYPDQASLAPESNYVPPVRDSTASQASLRLNYILGQDAYGTRLHLSLKSSTLPIPDLAVGRLVETAGDMMAVLDAYLSTSSGVIVPGTALVSGYDFLSDSSVEVRNQLQTGLGGSVNALIAPEGQAPADSWTATDLATKLFDEGRHDLIYLAGHFSASSALAADYETRLLAEEVTNSSISMANTVVFSAGCHSGYNIVNEHGIANVTREPDWAQAFAQKGATLIAGTGYQYGDTEFIEYGERLYVHFSEQLRVGTGPVAIGDALVAAKQRYLADTATGTSSLHEKTLLIATIFGLPMLRVDMPAGRFTPPGDNSIVSSTTGYAAPGAGYELGLRYADIAVTTNLSLNTVQLVDVDDSNNAVTASYLAGPGGRVITRPAEPILPLELRNVSVPGQVLRGVGFRGGSYTDLANILPLTGAPTFDLRALRSLFTSDYLYPVQLWNVNYYDALADSGNGATRLMLTPAQFISQPLHSTTGILRKFNSLNLRLFYSNNFQSYDAGSFNNTPALSDPPAITRVLATTDASGNVHFSARVVGDPSAGVQEVWITYTGAGSAAGGNWKSLDLVQDPLDSTLWQGTLTPIALDGIVPADVRYMVQAVNGVGLVTLVTNLGAYYRPDVDPAQPSPPGQNPAPTTLTLESPPASGAFSTQATFSAVLRSNGTPLAGQAIFFTLGSQRRALTDSSGRATVTIPLSVTPGQYQLRVQFVGTPDYAPTAAASSFTITKQGTTLTLTPNSVSIPAGNDTGIVATLKDAAGRAILQRTVFFVVTGSSGSYSQAVITNYRGAAPLGVAPLPPGSYSVNAYFGTVVTLPNQTTVTLVDTSYSGSSASGTLIIEAASQPPACETASPGESALWPPDHRFVPIQILGVSDPDGDDVTITVTGIFQDERVNAPGSGNTAPDGRGVGTSTAEVRAERINNGNGRVYHISFTASDGQGGACSGKVLIGVPRNQGETPVDEGPLFDSTIVP